ncbi:Uncharacterised protein [Bordetella pertussis]|nr:Uncharacterised protein [Bordetella pertussis]
MSDRAIRTSSSLKGLMMAMTSFMAVPLMVTRRHQDLCKFHAMFFRTRGPGPARRRASWACAHAPQQGTPGGVCATLVHDAPKAA